MESPGLLLRKEPPEWSCHSLYFIEGLLDRQGDGLSEATPLVSRTPGLWFLGFLYYMVHINSQMPDGLELELQWGAMWPRQSWLVTIIVCLFYLLCTFCHSKQGLQPAYGLTREWVTKGLSSPQGATSLCLRELFSEQGAGPELEGTQLDTERWCRCHEHQDATPN